MFRECEKRRLLFLGFEKWNGYTTEVNLQCKSCTNEKINTTLERFLKGVGNCKTCNSVFNKSKRDEEVIDKFFSTGKFQSGTIFSRDLDTEDGKGYYNNWLLKCPICAEDQFSANGICNGVFTAKEQTLIKGNLPCRCSTARRWTRPEREFTIKTLLDSEGSKWKGWHPSEDLATRGNNHSKFLWECSNSHSCSSSVGKFIDKGTRCKSCLEGDGQYYKLKADHLDICYLVRLSSEEESFIKVGRSFITSFPDRLKTLGKKYDVKLLALNQQIHSIIRPEEKSFHDHLKRYHYIPLRKFGGCLQECFTLSALDDLSLYTSFHFRGEYNEQYCLPNFRRSSRHTE